MEKVILTYNSWSKYHLIIRVALLHGELVKIHPFVDGNGKTSRLLMNSVIINKLDKQIKIINDDIKNINNYYAKNSFDVITCNPPYFNTKEDGFVKLVTKLEVEMLKKYLELI